MDSTPVRHGRILPALALAFLSAACGGEQPREAARRDTAPATRDVSGTGASPWKVLPADLRTPQFGDLDSILARRRLRILVSPSTTNFFVIDGRLAGASYEMATLFESELNRQLGDPRPGVEVVFVPLPRHELVPALLAGYGDLVVAGFHVTAERAARVAFSDPLLAHLRKVVVAGETAAPADSLADLSGRTVAIRPGSSEAGAVGAANDRLRALGLAPIRVLPAPGEAEDGVLLELVASGALPATVVDEPIAAVWARVHPGLRVLAGAPLDTAGRVAWAARPGSPDLLAAVNAFAAGHRGGTRLGNIVLHRYYGPRSTPPDPTDSTHWVRFRNLSPLLRRYGREYDLPWLLLAAQGYQESQLDQSRRSAAGAVGVMQVLPSTARSPAVGIPDIDQVESNIHAGTKYLRHLVDRLAGDGAGEAQLDSLNTGLFALASYNAGPGRIASVRRDAERHGLDPDVWFNQTELSAARIIGRETVDYVRAIYRHYLIYRMLAGEADTNPAAMP